MNINIHNVPKAIVSFVIGSIAMFILYGAGDASVMPVLLDVIESIDLWDGFGTIAPIFWWGGLLFTMFVMVILPLMYIMETES